MKTVSKFTGFGYDVSNVVKIMNIIERLTGCSINEYGEDKESPRLVNVTVPNWEFVAIGAHIEPMNVHIPCLMRNIETGEWGWANDLIYFADKDGFCWSNGHYTTEENARREFGRSSIGGLIWYARGF